MFIGLIELNHVKLFVYLFDDLKARQRIHVEKSKITIFI